MADAHAAQALGVTLHTIATGIVAASHGKVTDLTDVPLDTVRAGFEHLTSTVSLAGIQLGALAGRGVAEAALDFAEHCAIPILMDLQLSGPSGETLLSGAGLEAVQARLALPNLVILGKTDAELLSGVEIHSLDDAQVAAHRIIRQGARAVIVKCGTLPARHFEIEAATRPEAAFSADLYFDGDAFALYEAPYLQGVEGLSASSAFSISILCALTQGHDVPEAIQRGKKFATDALRVSQSLGVHGALRYFRPGSIQQA